MSESRLEAFATASPRENGRLVFGLLLLLRIVVRPLAVHCLEQLLVCNSVARVVLATEANSPFPFCHWGGELGKVRRWRMHDIV